jgi:hypothetical protein
MDVSACGYSDFGMRGFGEAAAYWIPAFAGMTTVAVDDDGRAGTTIDDAPE